MFSRFKWLVAGLGLLCLQLSAQPTVSNITFDNIGDSSLRVIFNVSATPTATRIRFRPASGGGCSAQETGSDVYVQDWALGGSSRAYAAWANISGLAPATAYVVCPEATVGASYSSGATASVTTLARTTTTPTAPTAVPTTFPAQVGNPLTVASDCHDLQAKMDTAVDDQAVGLADTITVPAATTCTGQYTWKAEPNKKTFAASGVVISTSRITTTTNHNLTNNDEIRFSSLGYPSHCLPGKGIFYVSGACDWGGGVLMGARYYAGVVNATTFTVLDAPSGTPVVFGWVTFVADSTTEQITFYPPADALQGLWPTSMSANYVLRFHNVGGGLPGGLSEDVDYYMLTGCSPSVNVACVSQVSTTSGGSAVNITSTGTGTNYIADRGVGTMYVVKAPPSLAVGPNILLTSGGTLPAAGTQTAPSYDAQNFIFAAATLGDSHRAMFTGVLSHNIIIVGAMFSTTASIPLTATDVPGSCNGFRTYKDSSNIIFDRMRVKGPGYPGRFNCADTSVVNFWDGVNTGIINSYMDGMDVWHPWVPTTDFAPSFTSTIATYQSGTHYSGPSFCSSWTTSGVITITKTSGTAGTAYVYIGLDCNLHVLPQTSSTWTCVATGKTCTVESAVASPDWPTGGGRKSVFPFGTITFTGSNITATTGPNTVPGTLFSLTNVNTPEGANSFLGGNGPGPFLLYNNYISGTGLPFHFDDSGGAYFLRADYTISYNTFDTPSTQVAGGPNSLYNLRYGQRQPLEWKGGSRALVSYNNFYGCFGEINPWSVCIAITPLGQARTSDFDISNNVFGSATDATKQVSGGFQLPTSLQYGGPPSARNRAYNNLIIVDAYNHYVPGVGTPRGQCIMSGTGTENTTLDHNTCYVISGSTGAFFRQYNNPVSGMTITNNVYLYNGQSQMIIGEGTFNSCSSTFNKSIMECAFTSGPGIPSYIFKNNLIIPWYNSTIPTASGVISNSTISTAFSGNCGAAVTCVNTTCSLATNCMVPDQGSASANLSYANFAATLRLASASPYYAACSSSTPCGYYQVIIPGASTSRGGVFRGSKPR